MTEQASTDSASTEPWRPRLTLLSREDCPLCEEMLLELQLAAAARPGRWELEVLDVDTQQHLRSRYGHKVPALLLGGELVCHGRLDLGELDRELARQQALKGHQTLARGS